jgi:hypothetical protein
VVSKNWPSLQRTEWYKETVEVLRPPAPAPVVADRKSEDDMDNDFAEYNAEYAKTTVYAEYQNLDATDPLTWVNARSENSAELSYFRMNVHFYSMKGQTQLTQTILCSRFLANEMRTHTHFTLSDEVIDTHLDQYRKPVNARKCSVFCCTFVVLLLVMWLLPMPLQPPFSSTVNREQIMETMTLITSGLGRPRLRILFLTSPPWGNFIMDAHDRPISQADIAVRALTLNENSLVLPC